MCGVGRMVLSMKQKRRCIMNNIAMWVIIGAVAFFAICGIWGCCKCWGRRHHGCAT